MVTRAGKSSARNAEDKTSAQPKRGAQKKASAQPKTGAPRKAGAELTRASKKASAQPPAGAQKSTRAKAGSKAGKPAASAVGLDTYRSMRDFAKTAEPAGGGHTQSETGNAFVIQKHAASHLHYDFRLELDGVLLSWSVPKGPSLRPADRRLAVRTEDHPLEYASFEGIIPKGEYGGGTVIVWDRGSWTPEKDARQGLAKGHLVFALAGEKLRGRFHLVRTARQQDKREHWLLFKGDDAFANKQSDIVSERPESAISGLSVEQVAATPPAVWHSNRTAHDGAPAAAAAPVASAESARATTRASKPSVQAGEAAGEPKQDVIQLVKRLPLPFGLTNLDKVLYPENNLRKADLIAYYAAVASHALPHLAGRPLTLVRCPGGRTQKCFFQKHATANVPAAVQRIDVREPGDGKASAELYMAVKDLAGLVAVAQLGALELHTWTCHADKLERPDQWVFDLDPDLSLPWDAVVEAAFVLKKRLSELSLESFVKTTGGKGLHVVVPVAPKLSWETHHAFAKAVADSVARTQPQRYLTNMRKDLRKGKLFIDYLRNGRGATAIAPYSTRAREGATVATPISWAELEHGVDPAAFDVYGVIQRLEALQTDPWKAYVTTKQSVSASVLKALKVQS